MCGPVNTLFSNMQCHQPEENLSNQHLLKNAGKNLTIFAKGLILDAGLAFECVSV